ncbi:MAG: hypothetical protein EA379_05155 [Phycisphaerales bacterium]|nr:MAG: hypothetical protein EA379_05155 [Phycisphaerales bacterium]
MSGVVGMAMSAALGMYLVYTSGALRTRVLDVVMINPAAWLGFAIMVWGLPMFLSMIEALGIRFIGRRRGWRTTDEVALVVVAHASVGWLAAPATILLGLGCLGLMTAISFIFPMFIPPMFIGWYADLGIVYLVFAMLLVLGHPLIGLLAFETLVFIGWRRMRFANREGGSVPR